MKCLVARFLSCESGTAVAKYGLIAGALSAAILTAAVGIATRLTIGITP